MQNFPPEKHRKSLFVFTQLFYKTSNWTKDYKPAAVQEFCLREDLTGKQQKLTLAFYWFYTEG